MNNEILAYAAGIVDGEGCVTVSYRPSSKSCQISVAVSMSCRLIPDWLQSNFGGNQTEELNIQGYGGTNAHKMFRWRIGGKEAQYFCSLIEPFLIEKKAQAELLQLVPKHNSGQHLSDTERDLQVRIAQDISSMNSNKGRKYEYA